MIYKNAKKFAKYGGIVAVFFEWLALVLFFLSQPSAFTGNLPISYFATLAQTRIIFASFYVIAAFSFWIFANHYLSRHYRTPIKIFALSMIGFAAMALAPFDPNNSLSNALHTLFSHSSFLLFLLGMYLMAVKNEDKRFRYITLAATTLSAVLIVLFRLAPEDSNLILPFEAGAWFICQLGIIWVSLIVYKKSAN